MPIPLTIKSNRLTLRQLKHDDWESLYEHYIDLDATKFTFGRSLTRRES
jgi:hypothetical protein